LEQDKAAGSEAFGDLVDEAVVVPDAGGDEAAVDEIELVVEVPEVEIGVVLGGCQTDA
jgi:hypothetical protein